MLKSMHLTKDQKLYYNSKKKGTRFLDKYYRRYR